MISHYNSIQNTGDVQVASNPMDLLFLVYDKIILNLKQIGFLMDSQQIESRSQKINNTLDLIGLGLLGCLTNNGTIVEQTLKDFYLASMGAIVHANIHNKKEDLVKLSQSFSDMKEVWVKISSKETV